MPSPPGEFASPSHNSAYTPAEMVCGEETALENAAAWSGTGIAWLSYHSAGEPNPPPVLVARYNREFEVYQNNSTLPLSMVAHGKVANPPPGTVVAPGSAFTRVQTGAASGVPTHVPATMFC